MRAADFSHGVTDAKLSSNGIGAANNSLSRAIFVVQSGFSSSAVYGAAGAAGGYLAVRFAEANALLKRQRYSRWIGPAVCACVTDRNVPLDEGYGLILYSFSGMDF